MHGREAAYTNVIVFDLTSPGNKHIRGEHATHYLTEMMLLSGTSLKPSKYGAVVAVIIW